MKKLVQEANCKMYDCVINLAGKIVVDLLQTFNVNHNKAFIKVRCGMRYMDY